MNGSGLRIVRLDVSIGALCLLDAVSLEIPRGAIVAVVGPNGAGKTTLLDAISGTIPYAGTIEVGGRPDDADGARRSGVGRVFQGSPLPETLTVAEVAALVTDDRHAAAELVSRFGLEPHATTFVGELSTGMRRILDFAVATVGSPDVLLLDEPASGLAQAEVERLAGLVMRWRDTTGASVVIVEHDAWLVREVADKVVVLEDGRVVAHGSPKTVLRGRQGLGVRIHSAQQQHFRDALGRVTSTAARPAPLPKRRLSKWTLLRLGLREMAAGMSSVLILGVLSRVLKVELGVSLGVVTAVLASYNLAAPVALAVGHRSDTRPILGRRRTPYVVVGAIVTGLAVAGAPHVAGRLHGGVTPEAVILSLLLFVAMGLGMYGAGTVFFALIADLTSPSERGHAASVVYLELMVGVLLGVALTGAILSEDHATQNLGTLFGVAGVLVAVLSTVAVWGQEKRIPRRTADEAESRGQRAGLGAAVRAVAALPMARRFFVFMVLSTLFIFLQQAVLTPFGGDVLGLSVRATSGFNAMLTVGTIAGMIVAGRPAAEQFGHRRVALIGLAGCVLAFAGLSTAAAGASAPGAWLSIMFLGFAAGIFNVSSLALMMGMSDRRRTALFMGAWTLAHALADGAATAGGGAAFEAGARLFGSVPGGYAAVFGLEAIGLVACVPLLRRIDPDRFAAETGEDISPSPVVDAPLAVASLGAASSQAPDGAASSRAAGNAVSRPARVRALRKPSGGSRASAPSPRRSGAASRRTRNASES